MGRSWPERRSTATSRSTALAHPAAVTSPKSRSTSAGLTASNPRRMAWRARCLRTSPATAGRSGRHRSRPRRWNRGKARATPSKFEFHLWDLGAVAAALQQSNDVADSVKSTARDALDALQPGVGAVLAEGHQGAWFDGTRGVSIYLPVVARISPWYPKLTFANDTQWDEMLVAYRQQFECAGRPSCNSATWNWSSPVRLSATAGRDGRLSSSRTALACGRNDARAGYSDRIHARHP